MHKKETNNLIEYTCGFYKRELNFSIENLPPKKSKYPFYIDLTEKMLLRGMPAKPSRFLIERLIEYYPSIYFKSSDDLYLINDKSPIWTDKTIQGSPTNPNDNPAFLFFQNLKKELKEYSFITNLIIPEYEIAQFCPEIVNKLNSLTRVDFFLPIIPLVIEIDGLQHSQKLDKLRDSVLNDFGIKILI